MVTSAWMFKEREELKEDIIFYDKAFNYSFQSFWLRNHWKLNATSKSEIMAWLKHFESIFRKHQLLYYTLSELARAIENVSENTIDDSRLKECVVRLYHGWSQISYGIRYSDLDPYYRNDFGRVTTGISFADIFQPESPPWSHTLPGFHLVGRETNITWKMVSKKI